MTCTTRGLLLHSSISSIITIISREAYYNHRHTMKCLATISVIVVSRLSCLPSRAWVPRAISNFRAAYCSSSSATALTLWRWTRLGSCWTWPAQTTRTWSSRLPWTLTSWLPSSTSFNTNKLKIFTWLKSRLTKEQLLGAAEPSPTCRRTHSKCRCHCFLPPQTWVIVDTTKPHSDLL